MDNTVSSRFHETRKAINGAATPHIVRLARRLTARSASPSRLGCLAVTSSCLQRCGGAATRRGSIPRTPFAFSEGSELKPSSPPAISRRWQKLRCLGLWSPVLPFPFQHSLSRLWAARRGRERSTGLSMARDPGHGACGPCSAVAAIGLRPRPATATRRAGAGR